MTTDRKAWHTVGPLDGGSAFPNDGAWANGHPEGGMSLRDWFAGQALAGYLADPTTGPAVAKAALANGLTTKQIIATNAYRMADAMLAEREKAENEHA